MANGGQVLVDSFTYDVVRRVRPTPLHEPPRPQGLERRRRARAKPLWAGVKVVTKRRGRRRRPPLPAPPARAQVKNTGDLAAVDHHGYNYPQLLAAGRRGFLT